MNVVGGRYNLCLALALELCLLFLSNLLVDLGTLGRFVAVGPGLFGVLADGHATARCRRQRTGRVASCFSCWVCKLSSSGSSCLLLSLSSLLAMERSSSGNQKSARDSKHDGAWYIYHTRVVGLVRLVLALVEAVFLLLLLNLGLRNVLLVTVFVDGALADV